MLNIILIVFLISQAFAQTDQPQPVGIQPDNILWGLDVAIDNIRMALEQDDVRRAEIALDVAEERLQEVKEMIKQKKLSHAENAKNEHDKMLVETNDAVTEIESDNDSEELEKKIMIEKRVEQHKQKIKIVDDELKIEIKIKGDVTPEQQTMIDSLIASMEGNAGELEIEIENEEGKTKIEIEQKTGRSHSDVEREAKDIKERVDQELDDDEDDDEE